MKIIPKNQQSAGDYGFFSSYFIETIDDKFYLLFNDSVKNYPHSDTGKVYSFTPASPQSTVLSLVVIDSKGNETKEALLPLDNSGIIYSPIVSGLIGERELLLYGQNKKKHRFTKLTFK